MAHHNPEHSAGAQLAMLAALKLLLTPYRGNAQAIRALESELEEMRALLLGSAAEEQKLAAFEQAAESLIHTLRSSP